MVLHMARQGIDLKGAASFHGDLVAVKSAQPGGIKSQILVLTGADGPFVPPGEIWDFMKEMKSADATFTIIVYSGAVHAFTNPDATDLGKKFDLPLAYSQRADRESWAELERFLKEIFGQPKQGD